MILNIFVWKSFLYVMKLSSNLVQIYTTQNKYGLTKFSTYISPEKNKNNISSINESYLIELFYNEWTWSRNCEFKWWRT